jgi:DNA repair protein RadC
LKNLKDIPDIDKPREKMIAKGPSAMSDIELLALILGSGNKGVGVLDLSKRVLSIFDEHANPTVKDLTAIDGVGQAKACQLAAEIGRAHV